MSRKQEESYSVLMPSDLPNLGGVSKPPLLISSPLEESLLDFSLRNMCLGQMRSSQHQEGMLRCEMCT